MNKYLRTIGFCLLLCLLMGATFAQQNQRRQTFDTPGILHAPQRGEPTDGSHAIIYLPNPPAKAPSTETIDQASRSLPPAVYTPPSARLERIAPTERDNAIIQLELPNNPATAIAVPLAKIERLWNQGQYEVALAQLQQLESSYGQLEVAVAISWKTPKAIQTPVWGSDVKIGSRGSIYKACLDFDSSSGNLLVALKYWESSYYYWSVNISKDNGSTWYETYTYGLSSYINDISAVVLSGYFYVGYTIGTDARIRRFSVSDGYGDSGYGYHTIFNKGSEVRYLGLTSNADDDDNTILYLGLLANYSIIYYYGNITGTSWTEVPTGITNAYRGLDVAYNEGYDKYYLSISYIDVSYYLRVAQTDDYGGWRYLQLQQLSSSDRYTSIAAYDDRVITAYEYRPSGSPTRIRYNISYDGGTNWYSNEFSSSAGNSLYGPDLAARKNNGISLTFTEETSSFGYCWYTHRDYGTGPGTTSWSALETFNYYDVNTSYPMAISWIPPRPGYSTAYGAIYISDNAFFDRLDAVVGPNTINVTSPNGGEVWKVDTPYEITWDSDNYVGRVMVEISTTGGSSWWDVTQGTFTSNDGSYIYTPVSQNISASCLFRVTSIENPAASDDSDNEFTILDASSLKYYVAAHVPHGTAEPVIDGDLSDPAWSCVTGTEILQRGGVPDDFLTPWSNFTDNKVSWKALWSASTNLLYIAIEIQDDIAGAVDNDYNNLWQDDCIELFTDGDHNGGRYSGSYFNAQQWLIRRDNTRHLESLSGAYTGPAITSAVRHGSNGNWVLELAMVIYDHYPSDIRPLVMYDIIGWEVWYDDSDNSHQEGGKWARDHQVGWGYVGPAWYNADAFQQLQLGPAGTPPQQPDISINPTSWDYGAVAVGGYSDKTFVVKNDGNANLSVTATTLTGANSSEFSIISGGGSFTLSPGATRSLTVRFAPITIGNKSATLSISSNDPDPSENPLLVSLTGSGTAPDISVDPGSWNYGNVAVGGYQEKTFVVKNDGNANLNVTATTLTGANASEFSIQSGGGSFTLGPLATRNIVIRFAPTTAGSKTAALSINSNDPDENPFTVSLSGTGTVPDISVNPASWDFGAINVGSYADHTFVVKNDGSANLVVTATTLTGTHAAEFSIQSGGGSFTLTPGATQNIVIRFSPASGGNKTASLSISSNDPDENPLLVNLSGIGKTLGPAWSVPITVRGGNTTYTLTFGGDAAATDGFDSGLDVSAAPPGMTYYAYWEISAFPNYLSTDIRSWVAPFTTEITWTMKIVNAASVVSNLSWSTAGFPTTPSGWTFTLKGTAGDVDMKTATSATVTGNATLTIKYSSMETVTFTFAQQGWYLISLPVTPTNGNLNVLFPTAMAAFAYNSTSGNYYPVTALEPKKGYWLLIPSPTSATISGAKLSTYTAHYSVGWHLIGTVKGTTNFTDPNDTPNGAVIAAYGYDTATGKYFAVYPPGTGKLEEKQGYWLAVMQACDLTIGSGPMGKELAALHTTESEFYRQFGSQPPQPPFMVDRQIAQLLPSLSQIVSRNYPNPFNPETVIEYRLPQSSATEVCIYNALGQRIRTLFAGEQTAGVHTLIWDSRNDQGESVSDGIYFYQIRTPDLTVTQKMILLR
jgi:hypothetical protein